jgi:predicted TIM-barrel fold metal-dependent hydrolase
MTRRELMALLGAPVAAGGCCLHRYPKATTFGPRDAAAPVVPLVEPARARTHRLSGPAIDVHAHFFNASDVPVRGFVAECIGHSQEDPRLRRLIELAALVLETIARLAPTAADELKQLRAFDRAMQNRSSTEVEVTDQFARLIDVDRRLASERLAKAISGSALERELLAMKSSPAAPPRGGTLSADEIRDIVTRTRRPSPTGDRAFRPASPADVADGFITFLSYMLSMRASNLETHHDVYASGLDAFGIDLVLGSLVDFDYWIDCPPRSAQDDQLALHARLAKCRPTYFKPLVAYNPWTDIEQKGAGLARVVKAITALGFVGVKIYPPIGFMPAGNAANYPPTSKKYPNLKTLDTTLKAFFAKCAEIQAPVLAHTAHTNGRDTCHDEFGGPEGWRTLIDSYAADAGVATIDFGHFGGGKWMQDFAVLMKDKYERRLYGDLGYREELMCPEPPDQKCRDGRDQLRSALDVPITKAETVADRVMFGSDWLMLSLVKGWPDYPALVLESLQAIASDDEVEKIFGLNAINCFNLTI